MLLHPEFFIYKLLNPPKYKKHRPVKIPKATKHYEITFSNNPIFKNTLVLDKETFNNANNTHLECPFLYDSNNLCLSYSKKIQQDEQHENQYHWRTPSRSFALTNPSQEIINLKQSHNIDFYQKENTLESGLLDINTISFDNAKKIVTLETTPFDRDLENKKNHYFETYANKMALFSLMTKVFFFGIFFHIGLSNLGAQVLNKCINSMMMKSISTEINQLSLFEATQLVSNTLTLIGVINKCLNKPNSNGATLALGSVFIISTSLMGIHNSIKLNTLGSSLISAGLYAASAKKTLNEGRVFCFFSKTEFDKEILTKAKKFVDYE